MSFKTAIRTRIKDDAAVAAIAGANIYWSARPQGSPYPAVVLTTVFAEEPQHFSGYSSNLKRSAVQIDCYASTQKEAADLRQAVVAAIVPEATAGGVTFQRAFPDWRDDVRQTSTGEVYREIIEAEFRHN